MINIYKTYVNQQIPMTICYIRGHMLNTLKQKILYSWLNNNSFFITFRKKKSNTFPITKTIYYTVSVQLSFC